MAVVVDCLLQLQTRLSQNNTLPQEVGETEWEREGEGERPRTTRGRGRGREERNDITQVESGLFSPPGSG